MFPEFKTVETNLFVSSTNTIVVDLESKLMRVDCSVSFACSTLHDIIRELEKKHNVEMESFGNFTPNSRTTIFYNILDKKDGKVIESNMTKVIGLPKENFTCVYDISKKQLKELQQIAMEEGLNHNAPIIGCTDFDTCQFCIEVSEDKFIYSQNEGGDDRFRTGTISLSDIGEDDIENVVSSYYGSLEQLKEANGSRWKQILIECAFEEGY